MLIAPITSPNRNNATLILTKIAKSTNTFYIHTRQTYQCLPSYESAKAPAAEPSAAPPAKKTGPVGKAIKKVKEAVATKPKVAVPEKKDAAAPTAKSAKSTKVEVGDTVDLEGFGGEIETNAGEKTTLKALVDESKSGVVLFTYPKASTPGCKLPSSGITLRRPHSDGIRHHSSLSLPRLIRTAHLNRLCHLRTL